MPLGLHGAAAFTSPLVVVVDDVLAKGVFPGNDAIGEHLIIPGSDQPLEIVGVVRHVKHWGLARIRPSPPGGDRIR